MTVKLENLLPLGVFFAPLYSIPISNLHLNNILGIN